MNSSILEYPEKARPEAAHPVHELITARWSGRAYTAETVSDQVLNSLFEAARWAPSAFNAQPWHFLVTRIGSEAYERLADTLMPGNQGWAKAAPVLVLNVVRSTMEPDGRPNSYAWHDLGLAVGNLLHQATAAGLNVHQMAGFDRAKAAAAFKLPREFEAVSVMAIGYRGTPDQLEEPLRTRELAPQRRRHLSEFVFDGSWPQTPPA